VAEPARSALDGVLSFVPVVHTLNPRYTELSKLLKSAGHYEAICLHSELLSCLTNQQRYVYLSDMALDLCTQMYVIP
jgi:hypothetical protein